MIFYIKYALIWLGFMALFAVATLFVHKIAEVFKKNNEQGETYRRRGIFEPLSQEEIDEGKKADELDK